MRLLLLFFTAFLFSGCQSYTATSGADAQPDAQPSSGMAGLLAQYGDDIEEAVDEYMPMYLPARWAAQIWQESRGNPSAESPVGAGGLAQIMPGTQGDIQAAGFKGDRFDPQFAIFGGAWYQAKQTAFWGPAGRSPVDRWRLGAAGYNAGNGTILGAQKICSNARLWEQIQPCLIAYHLSRGKTQEEAEAFSHETSTYVRLIDDKWFPAFVKLGG